MMGEVLVLGAAIASFIMVGLVLCVGACLIIGKEIADRSPSKTLVIPESADEQFVFADRVSALRNRTTQLQADEAARAG